MSKEDGTYSATNNGDDDINDAIIRNLPQDQQERIRRVATQAAEQAKAAELAKLGQGVPSVSGLAVISVADLQAKEFKPKEHLVDGIVARGDLGIIAGRPKIGKSQLALDLVRAVDVGADFLGRTTRQAKALYIGLEDGERRIRERTMLLKWQGRAAAVATYIANFDGENGLPGPGLEQLREAVTVGGYGLVVVDTLIATLSGRANENDNAQMAAIVNELARIAEDTDTALLLVHHTGKGYSEDVFNTLRGASALRGAYKVGMVLEGKNNEQEALLHIEGKDIEYQSMTLQRAESGIGWRVVGDGQYIQAIRAGRVAVDILTTHGDGLTAAELAEATGKTAQAIRSSMKTAEDRGYVTINTEDGQPYTYSLAQGAR